MGQAVSRHHAKSQPLRDGDTDEDPMEDSNRSKKKHEGPYHNKKRCEVRHFLGTWQEMISEDALLL